MPRIAVIGGYGAFGGHVARRLARTGDVELVIAGRDLGRAEAAAAELSRNWPARVTAARFDGLAVTPEQLEALGVGVVVNASGPFQAQDYRLARAAIAARCHYVDLADAREFVTGIAALDAEARGADVLIVSGASTVPGLSSAVVKAHLDQIGTLTGLDIGISPGNSFDPGEATTASILSYIGKPIPARPASGRAFGWQGLTRHAFPRLGKRWMGYVDVPDLELFPAAYPRLTTLTTRAGVEVALFHFGFWMLSGLARLGLLRRPERLARPLLALKRRLSFLGSDAGGMYVTMDGVQGTGDRTRLEWHLLAGRGHGPNVPAIASVILARKLARGLEPRRGAMACFELFTLEEFMDEVRDLDIQAGLRLPLYRRLLGERYGLLPEAVQGLHDSRVPSHWNGAAEVTHGTSLVARLSALVARFPAATNGLQSGFQFSLDPKDGEERWARGFRSAPGAPSSPQFVSWQWEDDGKLNERLKGWRFVFGLDADRQGLRLVLERCLLFGVPLPRVLHPIITTLESEREGRYHFEVEAQLPLGLGRLVRYSGWLERS